MGSSIQRAVIFVSSTQPNQNVLQPSQVDLYKVTCLYGQQSRTVGIEQVWIPTKGWVTDWRFKQGFSREPIKEQIANAALQGAIHFNFKVVDSHQKFCFPDYSLTEIVGESVQIVRQ